MCLMHGYFLYRSIMKIVTNRDKRFYLPNKPLQLTAFSLRYKAAVELYRYKP